VEAGFSGLGFPAIPAGSERGSRKRGNPRESDIMFPLCGFPIFGLFTVRTMVLPVPV
jgi:hypothetical protein